VPSGELPLAPVNPTHALVPKNIYILQQYTMLYSNTINQIYVRRDINAHVALNQKKIKKKNQKKKKQNINKTKKQKTNAK
jgi:hypothetical protein